MALLALGIFSSSQRFPRQPERTTGPREEGEAKSLQDTVVCVTYHKIWEENAHNIPRVLRVWVEKGYNIPFLTLSVGTELSTVNRHCNS
jgi:hypothetical protein